jgi:hypothetical protein
LQHLEASLHQHIGIASQFDDITALAVRRLSAISDLEEPAGNPEPETSS